MVFQRHRTAGRRPAGQSAREDILAAAQSLFAAHGYSGTTLRAIAAEAQVDPALIAHYFGTKQEMFVTVMAPTTSGPAAIAQVLEGDPEMIGVRLAHFFVSMLENKTTGRIIVGLIRATSSEPLAAAMLKNVLARPILHVFKTAAVLDEQAEIRASLVQSQLLGLVTSRYILKMPPLVTATPEELVQYLGPTIQRYLMGDINAETKGGNNG